MLTVIFFVTIALGLIFSKSKHVRIVQYAVIILVFVFNSWNQDDQAYRRIYSGYYGLSHEPGFDLLCQICYKNGVSFETFRMIFVSFAIILLLVSLKKLFKNPSNRAYSLILLYPLLPFVELLRNLMAIAIVTYGIAWFFSVDKVTIKRKIGYAFIILIGATFHYNVLFFLVLLLGDNKKKKLNPYKQIVILSVLSIAICNLPFFNGLIRVLFKSEKVNVWFASTNRIGWGIGLVLLFHIVSFIIYDLTYRAYLSKQCWNIDTLFSEKREKALSIEINGVSIVKKKSNKGFGYDISDKLYLLNVYSFALMGFYTFNTEFFARLYSFILLLNCFQMSTVIRKIKNKNTIILNIMQVVYHIAMFLFFCQPFNGDGIMAFILQNNFLF